MNKGNVGNHMKMNITSNDIGMECNEERVSGASPEAAARRPEDAGNLTEMTWEQPHVGIVPRT